MNTPNMSYCMWENTSRALNQLIHDLKEASYDGISKEQYIEDRSSLHERVSVKHVLNAAQRLIDEWDELQS